MEIKISGVYTYVPKWRGNDKLSPDEQITVEHTYLSPEEEEKYTTFFPVYKGKEEIELEVKSNACAIWNSCVKRVEGFVDAETKQPVMDPLKVGKIPGIYGLITEVVAHIKKGFDEEELKKLRIALWFWLKGYGRRAEYFSKLPPNSFEAFGTDTWRAKVDRSRIKEYLTPAFYRQLEIWVNVRKWGWPDGKPWAQQPRPMLDLINLWNSETDEYTEQESKRGNSGNSKTNHYR